MEVYRDGRTEDALKIFRDISVRFNEPEVVGISSFMAGSIIARSESLSMSDSSEEYLNRVYSNYPLIGDYALYTLAGVYEKKGDYSKAADSYMEVFSTYPNSVLQKKSLIRAADLYIASGDTGKGRSVYETFLSRYSKDRSVPHALYGIGISYIMEDNVAQAFIYLERIWVEYPASPVSLSAKNVMEWLKKEGYEPPPNKVIDYFKRGESLFNAGLYEEAAAEYKRFLVERESVSAGEERDAYYKLSLSYYNARDLKEAEDALEFFLNTCSNDKRTGEALYSLGRNYLREGKDNAYVKSSKAYINLYRNKEKRPEVIYRLGMYYADKKEINTAFRYLDKVIREYPHTDFASDSKWSKGWLLYKEKKYKKALSVFNNILKEKNSTYLLPKTLYWKAKVLEAMDDHDGMEKSLCQLCNRHNGSFYCLFAGGNFDIPCVRTENPHPLNPLPRGGGGYEGMTIIPPPHIAETVGGEDEGADAKRVLPEDTKIKLLFYLGFKEEAADEIRRIQNRLKEEKDIEMAVSLSSLLYEAGEYNTSLGVLYTNFSKETLYSGRDIDMKVWRLMYPDGYNKLVKKYAEENSVDPFLLYALIREESWFNKEAVSSSGAIGLMQLMPKTASSIMNVPHVDRSTISDPGTNISLGARFFSDLLRRFSGNKILAIASYNAGPNAVTRWLKERSGFEMDEFIEDIPYKETRDYVKKVFSSYNEYQRINSMFLPASED